MAQDGKYLSADFWEQGTVLSSGQWESASLIVNTVRVHTGRFDGYHEFVLGYFLILSNIEVLKATVDEFWGKTPNPAISLLLMFVHFHRPERFENVV